MDDEPPGYENRMSTHLSTQGRVVNSSSKFLLDGKFEFIGSTKRNLMVNNCLGQARKLSKDSYSESESSEQILGPLEDLNGAAGQALIRQLSSTNSKLVIDGGNQTDYAVNNNQILKSRNYEQGFKSQIKIINQDQNFENPNYFLNRISTMSMSNKTGASNQNLHQANQTFIDQSGFFLSHKKTPPPTNSKIGRAQIDHKMDNLDIGNIYHQRITSNISSPRSRAELHSASRSAQIRIKHQREQAFLQEQKLTYSNSRIIKQNKFQIQDLLPLDASKLPIIPGLTMKLVEDAYSSIKSGSYSQSHSSDTFDLNNSTEEQRQVSFKLQDNQQLPMLDNKVKYYKYFSPQHETQQLRHESLMRLRKLQKSHSPTQNESINQKLGTLLTNAFPVRQKQKRYQNKNTKLKRTMQLEKQIEQLRAITNNKVSPKDQDSLKLMEVAQSFERVVGKKVRLMNSNSGFGKKLMASKSVHTESNKKSQDIGTGTKIIFPEEFDPKFFKLSQALQQISKDLVNPSEMKAHEIAKSTLSTNKMFVDTIEGPNNTSFHRLKLNLNDLSPKHPLKQRQFPQRKTKYLRDQDSQLNSPIEMRSSPVTENINEGLRIINLNQIVGTEITEKKPNITITNQDLDIIDHQNDFLYLQNNSQPTPSPIGDRPGTLLGSVNAFEMYKKDLLKRQQSQQDTLNLLNMPKDFQTPTNQGVLSNNSTITKSNIEDYYHKNNEPSDTVTAAVLQSNVQSMATLEQPGFHQEKIQIKSHPIIIAPSANNVTHDQGEQSPNTKCMIMTTNIYKEIDNTNVQEFVQKETMKLEPQLSPKLSPTIASQITNLKNLQYIKNRQFEPVSKRKSLKKKLNIKNSKQVSKDEHFSGLQSWTNTSLQTDSGQDSYESNSKSKLEQQIAGQELKYKQSLKFDQYLKTQNIVKKIVPQISLSPKSKQAVKKFNLASESILKAIKFEPSKKDISIQKSNEQSTHQLTTVINPQQFSGRKDNKYQNLDLIDFGGFTRNEQTANTPIDLEGRRQIIKKVSHRLSLPKSTINALSSTINLDKLRQGSNDHSDIDIATILDPESVKKVDRAEAEKPQGLQEKSFKLNITRKQTKIDNNQQSWERLSRKITALNKSMDLRKPENYSFINQFIPSKRNISIQKNQSNITKGAIYKQIKRMKLPTTTSQSPISLNVNQTSEINMSNMALNHANTEQKLGLFNQLALRDRDCQPSVFEVLKTDPNYASKLGLDKFNQLKSLNHVPSVQQQLQELTKSFSSAKQISEQTHNQEFVTKKSSEQFNLLKKKSQFVVDQDMMQRSKSPNNGLYAGNGKQKKGQKSKVLKFDTHDPRQKNNQSPFRNTLKGIHTEGSPQSGKIDSDYQKDSKNLVSGSHESEKTLIKIQSRVQYSPDLAQAQKKVNKSSKKQSNKKAFQNQNLNQSYKFSSITSRNEQAMNQDLYVNLDNADLSIDSFLRQQGDPLVTTQYNGTFKGTQEGNLSYQNKSQLNIQEVQELPFNVQAKISDSVSPKSKRVEFINSPVENKNLDIGRYVETDIDIQISNSKLEGITCLCQSMAQAFSGSYKVQKNRNELNLQQNHGLISNTKKTHQICEKCHGLKDPKQQTRQVFPAVPQIQYQNQEWINDSRYQEKDDEGINQGETFIDQKGNQYDFVLNFKKRVKKPSGPLMIKVQKQNEHKAILPDQKRMRRVSTKELTKELDNSIGIKQTLETPNEPTNFQIKSPISPQDESSLDINKFDLHEPIQESIQTPEDLKKSGALFKNSNRVTDNTPQQEIQQFSPNINLNVLMSQSQYGESDQQKFVQNMQSNPSQSPRSGSDDQGSMRESAISSQLQFMKQRKQPFDPIPDQQPASSSDQESDNTKPPVKPIQDPNTKEITTSVPKKSSTLNPNNSAIKQASKPLKQPQKDQKSEKQKKKSLNQQVLTKQSGASHQQQKHFDAVQEAFSSLETPTSERKKHHESSFQRQMRMETVGNQSGLNSKSNHERQDCGSIEDTDEQVFLYQKEKWNQVSARNSLALNDGADNQDKSTKQAMVAPLKVDKSLYQNRS